MIKKLSILGVFLVWLIPCYSFSATLYIATDGTDSGNCTVSACATFSYAFGQGSANDTFEVADGTYTNNILANPPTGTGGSYTIVKAENDGGAIIELTTGSSSNPLRITSSNYVQIEGFKFVNNLAENPYEAGYLSASVNHIKVLRCAFVRNPSDGDSNTACVTVSSSYTLFEDCWMWGGGRYILSNYGGSAENDADHNVFRRCVFRKDRENSGVQCPHCVVSTYLTSTPVFQNCIVLDSDQTSYYTCGSGDIRGAFQVEQGTFGTDVILSGCIVLNGINNFISDAPTVDSPNETGNIYVDNTVVIDMDKGFTGSYYYIDNYRTTISMANSLIMDIRGNCASAENGCSAGFRGAVDHAGDQAVVTNTIFANIATGTYGYGYALYNVQGANDYNCFYNNVDNYGGSSTVGPNDITGTNPFSASILYPVRVESGSALDGAGSGGADIGPTILKRIGVSGTLYGDSGWDTTTSDDLWPWPNEDRIKTDMSGYPSNWPSGDLPNPVRGFTAADSLTEYVWEYLGNEIPCDIYGQCAETPSQKYRGSSFSGGGIQ